MRYRATAAVTPPYLYKKALILASELIRPFSHTETAPSPFQKQVKTQQRSAGVLFPFGSRESMGPCHATKSMAVVAAVRTHKNVRSSQASLNFQTQTSAVTYGRASSIFIKACPFRSLFFCRSWRTRGFAHRIPLNPNTKSRRSNPAGLGGQYF